MRLVLFNDYRLGVLKDGTVFDVSDALPFWDNAWPQTFIIKLCERFKEFQPKLATAAKGKEGIPVDRVKLLPPIVNPTKIVGAFSNYILHSQEMRNDPNIKRESPEVFIKPSSSLAAHGDVIELPRVPEGTRIQHEAELAAVIGRKCKGVKAQRAKEVVIGYSCLMDITVRGEGDRSRRKGYDTFTPLGPCFISAEELGDPHNLEINLWVNNELRQQANTKDMIFNTWALIEYTTRCMTLYPGDILATGTPHHVGDIQDGDTLSIEIENIGRMSLLVKARGW
ncbi:MAG: fumarylacetoacetate hydrolase family protein [Candidatus Binatia bacterium]